MFSNVLVICTGNICRSPMAEALLAERWKKPDTTVSSAGVHALVDHPAEPHAVDVMRERGGDISAHRARQVTAELVMGADLVLAMEPGQIEWVVRAVPPARGRVQLMSRWVGDDHVPDPYMQPRSAYEETFELLSQCVDSWIKRL